MSSHGLFDNYLSSEHRLSGDWIVQGPGHGDSESEEAAAISSVRSQGPSHISRQTHTHIIHDESYRDHRPAKRARVHFYDFAAQVRLQQHHERRKNFLSARKRALQKTTALSARLKRTSAWIQDGLVEISRHKNTAGFARVFSHAQDLIDTCFSHWNNHLQSLDTLHSSENASTQTLGPPPFVEQLPPQARADLLDLVSNLRGNPQFLVEKLRNLPRSQVATLTSKPKWEYSDSFLNSFSQDSGRSSQSKRRLQAYSKELEDYATSFERSNPLSFLLNNVYGHDDSVDSPESQLRLYNWSTICAELLRCGADSYSSLYWQVLEAYANAQEWPARTRIELFLVRTLHDGAFLIDDDQTQNARLGFNHLVTKQATEFFEGAVLDLYFTLINCGSGCFPPGALSLARAILGKLPEEAHQLGFRGHFLQHWYMNHFLRTAIVYPESESMLLKMHVSDRARKFILAPLFSRFLHKYENFQTPTTLEDENIRNIVEDMINMLDAQAAPNPYRTRSSVIPHDSYPHSPALTLVVCASEVVKVLETLSPQAIHSYSSDMVMREMGHAFNSQYTNAPTRFDRLKRDLTQLQEPGTSAKDIHPCAEAWSEVHIGQDGKIQFAEATITFKRLETLIQGSALDLPQKAALRLCQAPSPSEDDKSSPQAVDLVSMSSLTQAFEQQIVQAQADTRTLDLVYWKKALGQLHQQYPRSHLTNNDSEVLRTPLRHICDSREVDQEQCNQLEEDLMPCERFFQQCRRSMSAFTAKLEELRLKLWYSAEVINSEVYANAKNVAAALILMNLSNLASTTSIDAANRRPLQLRPTSSKSTLSSIFGQPRDETMKVLKASTEHGGPRKLADDQIENIRQWLQQNSIDNFCIGEERLHRFCMEIQAIAKKLTAETVLENSLLWYSELYARERESYGVTAFEINSAPASTRPASVMSDSYSTYPAIRPALRSSDSDVRSIMSDDRSSNRRGSVFNVFQRSLNPQLLPPALASSIGSHRTSSAATTTSDIFSAPVSVTSASAYSRAPSILSGGLPNFGPRRVTSVQEKKKFRDELRRGLICLLLSDLGCRVWGLGGETDAWINNAQNAGALMRKFEKRMSTKSLLEESAVSPTKSRRRKSTDEASTRINGVASPLFVNQAQPLPDNADTYLPALQDVLERLSQQIDPVDKLKACLDFEKIARDHLDSALNVSAKLSEVGKLKAVSNESGPRRNSLGSGLRMSHHDLTAGLSNRSESKASEIRVDQHLKRLLSQLKPKTIFRDLQYIAVFMPAETLEKTPAGNAFMRLGMAALDYKNELCGSMVDLADQIVATDAIKRSSSQRLEQPLSQAAEYWQIAAREGNAIAQRELATLYLMHPEILPVVTTPLSPTADIFKDEMMWQRSPGTNNNRQALCLALHWMQQAAKKGDKIAQRKLEERAGTGIGLSIR